MIALQLAVEVKGPVFGQVSARAQRAQAQNSFRSLANPANRLIQSIQAPDGATWAMTYDAAHPGQFASFTTPRQQTTHFVYDDWGRVLRDQAPDGSRQDLARTGWAWDYEVTRTTRLGRQTRYAVTRQNNGDRVHTHTFPDAGQSLQTVKPDGTRVTVLADGTTLTSKTGPDARFGMTKPRTTETKERDAVGRTTRQTLPDTSAIDFAYDARGPRVGGGRSMGCKKREEGMASPGRGARNRIRRY